MAVVRSHHARPKTRRVVVHSRDAVLRIDDVAAGLGVSVRTVERLDLPTIYIGRQRRYHWGTVLDVLKARAA